MDVGNTAIKIAIQDDPEVLVMRVADPATVNAIAQRLKEIGETGPPIEVRIASVNRAAANRLIEHTHAIAGANVRFRRITHADLLITVATDHPDRVGIDRIVGAFGATRVYPTSLVIVDAGTTVTVDLVDEQHAYRGGAILPGLQMQTDALGNGTDALPQINWQSDAASMDRPPTGEVTGKDVTGKNTVAAIRLGILSGIVGGIERLVRLYGCPDHVVVTGGDSPYLVTELQRDASLGSRIRHHPHLVCRTLVGL